LLLGLPLKDAGQSGIPEEEELVPGEDDGPILPLPVRRLLASLAEILWETRDERPDESARRKKKYRGR
jgi:hypothetical protein